MIAPARRVRPDNTTPAWHAEFMTLLPRIRACASFAFRRLDPEARQEAVQSVVASAMAAYVRLVQLGKADIAYAGPLAVFAIRQYRDGRRLGCRLNVRDVSSEYARWKKDIRLARLDRYDETEGCWREILVEDKTATPADLAASRIDFPAWLRTLSRRDRKIAMKLATGESTGVVARMFGISAGRVSQLRSELRDSWKRFHGEVLAGSVA